jgi:hypothetical protein
VVVLHERAAQPLFLDCAALREGLGDANHHLGVVGVIKRVAGWISDENFGRPELEVDVRRRQPLIRAADGVAGREAEQAPREAVRERRVTFPTGHEVSPK